MNRESLIGAAFIMVFSWSVSAALAGETYEKDDFAGQKIVVAGTGDCQKLLRAMGKALEMNLKGAQIDVPDSIGSGGGIKALADGQVDLARVARPLKDNEKALGLTYKLFAINPVVFVVHPSVTCIENLEFKDILDIYSGKNVKWEQLGAASGKIYPIIRESGDSSIMVLYAKIPGFKDIRSPKAKVIYTTPDAIAALSKYENTIGFFPMTETKGEKLRVLKINGVSPSTENVANGRYLLTTPFAIVYKKEPTGLAKAFIDFLYSEEGERIISDFGAVPSR